jgi:asparagine synthase (glutamine-hydrolysing)
MCGINGFNFKDEILVKSMNQALQHRGPDGNSFYTDKNVSLGHSRLSIIDLTEAGSQPMHYRFKDKELVIVFNGEIYNYIELKEVLIFLGYSFINHTDTEVIMAAYLEWGEKCVEKFNGMWAFCIYNMNQNILFCSRDRLGVKPFYYYYKNNQFIFSSELKAILKHTYLNINQYANLNKEAVELYFSLGYIPAPLTIYNNVYKLEAGHNIILNLDENKLLKYSYYKVPQSNFSFTKEDLIDSGKELFEDSVRLRMRSDVSVGAFLSGGLDSSAVVGKMKNFTSLKNLNTFSIGFESKKHDESEYINIAKGYFHSRHHHHIYNQSDFNETWPLYSQIFDEPFGDYSSFPSYSVCEMAAKNDVKVVLSGDGGDEIFGGYPIYNTGYILEKLYKLPIFTRKIMLSIADKTKNIDIRLFKLKELLRLSLYDKKDFYSEMFAADRYKPVTYQNWTSEKLTEALDLSNNNLSEGLRIHDLLTNTLSNNYLVKVDRTSMANSIEVRSPFLDYRFIEFSQQIPTRYKFGMVENKILMRDMIKGLVPDKIINRNKMGFTPPINDWLYSSISASEFERYTEFLKDFSLELYEFYKKILKSEIKTYMRDFYMMKLAIFGRWFDHWILSDRDMGL